MDATSELDCKVFLNAEGLPADLGRFLANALTGTLSGPPFAPIVQTRCGEVEIRANDEWDPEKARASADGFLFFRYAVEFYPSTACRHEDKVALVSTLLQTAWRRGWPAVAACDYEAELPCQGGCQVPPAPENGAIARPPIR